MLTAKTRTCPHHHHRNPPTTTTHITEHQTPSTKQQTQKSVHIPCRTEPTSVHHCIFVINQEMPTASLATLVRPRSAAVVVIGGGPAGYFAAITAARYLLSSASRNEKDDESSKKQDRSSQVILLESTSRPLKKVLASGGGRCNVMHTPLGSSDGPNGAATFGGPRDLSYNYYPRGRKEMVGPFTMFTQDMTKEWFEKGEGIQLKTESDGRIFPITDDARTISDALENAATNSHVRVMTNASVQQIKQLDCSGEKHKNEEETKQSFNHDNDNDHRTNNLHRFELSIHSKTDNGADGTKTNNNKKNDSKKQKSSWNLQCHSVLLATGSAPVGYRIAQSLHQPLTPRYPSLFSFRLSDGHPLENLQGISIPDAELTLLKEHPSLSSSLHEKDEHNKLSSSKKTQQEKTRRHDQQKKKKKKSTIDDFTQRGPLLITHRGISGPAALRLSSFMANELKTQKYKGSLSLNFIPSVTSSSSSSETLQQYGKCGSHQQEQEAIAASALREFSLAPHGRRKSVFTPPEFLKVIDNTRIVLPRRLWKALVVYCGKQQHQEAKENSDGNNATRSRSSTASFSTKQKWGQISNHQIQLLSKALVSLPLQFHGKDTNKEEFVTAGGIQLNGIRLKTMESKIVQGLHFAGEVIDVDGVTGGFNFQNCWTTGYLAGTAMAEDYVKETSRR